MTLDFKVFVRDLKELLKKTKNQKVEQSVRYQDDTKRLSIPIAHLTAKDIDLLKVILEERLQKFPDEKQARDNKWTRNRIVKYLELKNGSVDDKTLIKAVETLHVALKRFLELHAPHRWLFKTSSDHIDLPYFVTSIDYHKRKRDRDGDVTPAYVSINAKGYKNGTENSISASWSEDQFRPKPVSQLLAEVGLSIETPTAVASYLSELEKFAEHQRDCGLQMYAVGEAYSVAGDGWYRSWGATPMVKDGTPTRVVLDPLTEEIDSNKGEDESRVKTTLLWDDVPDRNGLTTKSNANLDEDEDELLDEESGKPLDAVEVMLPLHPYLYCFDLDNHRWVNIHVTNLQPYPWDEKLIDKLVLPEEQKGLLEILMSTTGKNVSDIVRGKMSGVIVIATGAPGTGKTLTAEVFSEFIKKPLYAIQCSQLGLDAESVEKELQAVLGRARRWGAVLLIDEADVYVRSRGDDIVQNAIVGIFLRVLEYYRGVLFMTSNQANLDDAILSRATAWIRYQVPDEKLLAATWKVLATQYKVNLSQGDVKRLVTKFIGNSGRSVRNILKLATMLKGEQATVDDLIHVSRYQALEKEEQ